MIKVHGRATSSNVQMVMWALAEIGLACERIDVGGPFGGTNAPEFRAMNPNGLVPVVEIDGLVLWESAAIVRYLGAAHGSEAFWPANPARRAPVDKWAEWIKTSFGPALLTGVFWPLVAVRPAERDQAALDQAIAKLAGLAVIFETAAPESGFFGGDDVCFADIITGTLFYRYFTLDFDRAETPRLRAYYDRLCARPAYAANVMISYDSMRPK
jgi:glutathione S-transferase